MKDENFNILGRNPRILVAPLDWGLGHATRCIPIIFKLKQQNCEVIVAAEGPGKFLLQTEFPQLAFIELRGYRIRYSRSKLLMNIKLLLQFPAVLYRIYAEQRWLKRVVEEYSIDAVISDNRMGLYHQEIPTAYITHQLQIKTGKHFTDRLVQKIHYWFINKFTECWVPDAAGKINLAGELSHPAIMPQTPVAYVGPLSRFEKKEAVFKYDLCVLLSGPEPQRTLFEKIVLKELDNLKGNIILIRGLPGETTVFENRNTAFEIKNHLAADELSAILQESKMVVCRSGYTTIMDLVKLGKKAILVPTPGQTEQEYLAGYLKQKELFHSIDQDKFSSLTLKNAIGLSCIKPHFEENNYEKNVERFVKQLTG